MLRHAPLLAVFFVCLLALPGRADAGLMDWVQELSGPGPSSGNVPLLYTHCWADRILSIRDKNTTTNKPCLFVDYRRFKNGSDDNFPAHVDLSFVDAGIVWELLSKRQLQLGAGVGFMHSESIGALQTTIEPVARTRFTISYARAVVEPLSFLFDKPNRFARVFKLYGRATLIPGTMDATDFGVPIGTGPGQSTWSDTNDNVLSGGVIFDFGELVR